MIRPQFLLKKGEDNRLFHQPYKSSKATMYMRAFCDCEGQTHGSRHDHLLSWVTHETRGLMLFS